MHLSNFFNSIKDSFIYKRRSIAEEQKKEVASPGKSSPPEKFWDREEKEINVMTRHTFITDSVGNTTPLVIRISPGTVKKRGSAHKKKQIPDPEDNILLDYILMTENLGAILLSLKRERGHFNCSIFVESEEIETFLSRNFEEIELFLDDYLQKAHLDINLIKWSIFSPEEKERLIHVLAKDHSFIDKRV